MSALTRDAAEKVERELARDREKTAIAYQRQQKLVAEQGSNHLSMTEAVMRSLAEQHATLRLHDKLVRRFGPEGTMRDQGCPARMSELLLHLLAQLVVTTSRHGDEAAKNVLAVVLDALDEDGQETGE